jgi:hypothetical protein
MNIIRPASTTEFPEARELSPEELAQAFALARAAFSPEDLQKFTELGEGDILLEDLLRKLQDRQQQSRTRAE